MTANVLAAHTDSAEFDCSAACAVVTEGRELYLSAPQLGQQAAVYVPKPLTVLYLLTHPCSSSSVQMMEVPLLAQLPAK